jgi:uncharacterized NAD(P)/FAD-binding protein YdhS
VAYGTASLDHLLNVPARWLGASPGRPDGFVTWARGRAPDTTPGSFLPRRWYGDYLADLLDHAAPKVDHVRSRAVDVVSGVDGVTVVLEDGRYLRAARAVLALGPSPSAWPGVLAPAGGLPGMVEDPWAPGAFDDLAPGDVLLVGSGLTAVDAVLTLRGTGRRLIAVSRHGLLPTAHCDGPPVTPADLTVPSVRSARELVAWVRLTIAEHSREGGDWREVVDALRPATNAVWASLPLEERRRLLATAHRLWEVSRHRMAPRVAATIAELRATGELDVRADRVDAVRVTGGCLEATLRQGGRTRAVAIVNCTGPTADVRRTANPLVRHLLDVRALRPGPLALGLDTDADGRVPNASGRLWVIGAHRRGRLWETTAIPEIRQQAAAIAAAWRRPASARDVAELVG